MSSLAKHLLRGIYNIKESILISVVTVHIGQSHGSTDHGATIHYQVEGLSIRELQAASVVCVGGRSVMLTGTHIIMWTFYHHLTNCHQL